MDLKQFQAYVQQFSVEHGWEQEPVNTRLCFLMTEVGELTQAVLRWEQQPGPDQRQAAGREIFDVIWNAVDVAIAWGWISPSVFTTRWPSTRTAHGPINSEWSQMTNAFAAKRVCGVNERRSGAYVLLEWICGMLILSLTTGHRVGCLKLRRR